MLLRRGRVLISQCTQRGFQTARLASTNIQLRSRSGEANNERSPPATIPKQQIQALPTSTSSPSSSTSSSESKSSSSSIPSSIIPSETQAHPYAGAREYADSQTHSHSQNAPSSSALLPTLQVLHTESSRQQSHAAPPFNTHHFLVELEKAFPTPTARSLMRATRALLVDRIGRVRRDALSNKDLENQAYLFRAALSESKTEESLRQRNDSAAMRVSMATLRREVEALDNKMKTDIATMKHEIQMDVDNRRTESKTELKRQDIAMEDVLRKAIIQLGALKADSEEARWTNMRKSVFTLFSFAIVIMVVFELSPKPKNPKSPAPPEPKPSEGEGLETMMT